MSDFFLNLSANRTASAVVRALGLPLPMPQPLDRASGPWESEPLAGRTVFAGLGNGGALAAPLARSLAGAGAALCAAGPADAVAAFRAAAARDVIPLDLEHPAEDVRPTALVFDASGAAAPASLREAYDFFHAAVRALRPCGRAVVLARPPEAAADPAGRAARRALEGFVRSMGREIGRRGATALILYVDEGAEDRLDAALRFVLSKRAAYISGQPIRLGARVPAVGGAPAVQALAGKVALVTGAARGIGEATARALAREGARVVVMDRPEDQEAAGAVAAAIGGTALAADVTAANAGAVVLGHVAAQHGGALDIVVHNAGITRDKTLANMRPEQWDLVLDVNLDGLIRLNEALLPGLREGGRIIALSSIGGIGGNVGQTNYAATKAGVIGYVQGLAPLCAARGITVNAIAPGFIETRMTAAIPLGTREVARRLCNLSQGGQPGDIAEAIAFLASPGAAGITGEVLRVCGGNFIGA